jgi:predicted amidohydrolase YtcJ
MRPAQHILIAIAALAAVAPAHSSRADPSQSGPVIFHGGRILTNDGRGGSVEALLQAGGRVVAVGPLSEIEARPDARGAARVDLQGATAVPGLQDAHGNLAALGRSLEEVDLRGCSSYEQVVARVKARAAVVKEGEWILGRGWDQSLWADADFPHHFLLSTAVPHNPVLLERVDGHAALCNLAALTLAHLDGVLDPEPKVKGGRVFLDEAKHASGMLLDAAVGLVARVIPPPDQETTTRRFLAAQDVLLADGLTCVHDMGTSREMLELLESLRAKGQLRLRVVCYLDGQGELKPPALSGLPMAPDAFDLLSVPGVRIMADGALGSRGAALIDDYADAPGERGLLLLSEDELNARIALIARAGLQPAVQATGDRANRVVLDAYGRMGVAVSGFSGLRPRIEQAQVVGPKDWPRFPALEVITSMQPSHTTSDKTWLEARLGEERTRGVYAWRALAPQLGRLAFGSDFPGEEAEPLHGLYAARTRPKDVDASALEYEGKPVKTNQTLDGAAALAGYTSGPAFAAFQEDRRGRLVPGYFCDMTVISVDPTRCAPEDLLQAKVLLTVINGAVVWSGP